MVEKIDSSDKSYLSFSEEEASELFYESFKNDPLLRIKTGQTLPWDLSVEYTDTSNYGDGNKASLCIRKIPDEDEEILITQKVQKDKEHRLSIVLPLVTNEPTYYTSKFEFNFFTKPMYNEIPMKKAKGGRDRVESVLRDSERFLNMYLLYQEYFTDNSIGIGRKRLDISNLDKYKIDFVYYHRRALEIIQHIKRGEIDIEPSILMKIIPAYSHNRMR